MLGNEHGGMNEVLADAYAITYDAKYLSCARRFSHKQLLAPMEKGKDCLDNMHANTQIPKVIGYQRIAELAHDMQYHNASEYFWEIVTRQRSLLWCETCEELIVEKYMFAYIRLKNGVSASILSRELL